MKKPILWLSLLFMQLIFLGCNSSVYTLQVVDEGAQEIYITYSKGSDIKVGDVFTVYHTMVQSSGGGGGHNHGGSSQHSERMMIASVKVSKIIDEGTAEVKVLSGTVHNGATVEKFH